jgi:hypothetical protein
MDEMKPHSKVSDLSDKSRRSLLKKLCYTTPRLIVLGSMTVKMADGKDAGSRIPPPPPNTVSQKVW